MSEYERSRTLPALPEIVFDEASDLRRGLEGWLPRGPHAAPAGAPAVSVRELTGRDTEALVSTDKERLRMEWGIRGESRYAGWLQVLDLDYGASEVTIHLSFVGGSQAPDDRRAGEALEASLNRLSDLVAARISHAG